MIPVLDLGDILYDIQTEVNEKVRMIVIQTDELSFGLLVKEAQEILEIPEEALKQIGLIAYHKTKYFSRSCKLGR